MRAKVPFRTNLPWVFALLLLLGLAAACIPTSTSNEAQLVEGKDLYLKYCSLCHAKNGEGYAADAANALANQDFLALATDEFLYASIERGRPGTPMSAWGKTRNGPLSPEEIDSIVTWIRNWQSTEAVALTSEPSEGVAQRGEPLYSVHCAACHGEEGGSGSYMSINNPEGLAAVPDDFLRKTIQKGRSGTPMVAYENTIPPQGIEDLVTLIRSWQKDTETPERVEPITELIDIITNPEGSEPDFSEGERYVGADKVQEELDLGARMALVDARPSSDYFLEHITGAVNVPFYSAEDYVEQLPRDTWIVVYCACPHAESGQVADLLEANGFTKVKVLDEGFFYWKEQGYPVTSSRD